MPLLEIMGTNLHPHGLRLMVDEARSRYPLNSQYLAITAKKVVNTITASNSAVLRFLLTRKNFRKNKLVPPSSHPAVASGSRLFA